MAELHVQQQASASVFQWWLGLRLGQHLGLGLGLGLGLRLGLGLWLRRGLGLGLGLGLATSFSIVHACVLIKAMNTAKP